MEEEPLWIAARDGTRLAASLYRPRTPPPWPVVLEARPYRKDDCTRADADWYQRFAAEGGLAAVRLDVRGTGSSEGLATDEYPPQEQADCCDVIAWLAAQPWCSGRVGMFGKSYSGFNAIQVAIERPPALKAIVAIYATDDRYTDDVHYAGGVRRGLDLLDYPAYMVAMNALPPVPALTGPAWRDGWAERVLMTEPWLLRWLGEPLDGPYWRHGSLRPGYDRIACATMIVAGWSDAYRNATFRMFERLTGPRRLLIGPWSHMRPEVSIPGPRVDIVPELIRWWDRWLRDGDRGAGDADHDPPITVFVRRPAPPERAPDALSGFWRHEPAWPPARAGSWELAGTAASVRQAATRRPEPEGSGGSDELCIRADAGLEAPAAGADGPPWGLAEEQTPEEAGSLVYDWPVGATPRELLGYPVLELRLRSSAPVAQLGVRLCDVLPDGRSLLVSRGVLNLTHRDSHTDPRPLPLGEAVAVRLELDATAFVFEPGHRLRLLLMGADWPSVWPPPTVATLGIVRSSLRLRLPVVEGPDPIAVPPRLPAPAVVPSPVAASRALPSVWRAERDLVAGETRFVIDHGAETTLRTGIRVWERCWGTIAVTPEDPAHAWADAHARFELTFPEAQVATEARVHLVTDDARQAVTVDLVVSEDGSERWRRRWQRTWPRGLQ